MIIFSNLMKEKIDTSIFGKLGKEILREEGVKSSEDINCIFTGNKHIKRLNRKYRGRNAPTDVLTFSFIEGEGSKYRKGMFGDIYISIEMAQDNAKKYGHSFDEEIKLLFVHGMLHLLGYDDESESDREVMRSKEKDYINK